MGVLNNGHKVFRSVKFQVKRGVVPVQSKVKMEVPISKLQLVLSYLRPAALALEHTALKNNRLKQQLQTVTNG